jgi:hypothetical protein
MTAPAFGAGDRVLFASVDSITLDRLGVHGPAPMAPVPAAVLAAFKLSGYQAYTVDLGALGKIVCVGAELTLVERAPVTEAIEAIDAIDGGDDRAPEAVAA